jgi:hypothetical protein
MRFGAIEFNKRRLLQSTIDQLKTKTKQENREQQTQRDRPVCVGAQTEPDEKTFFAFQPKKKLLKGEFRIDIVSFDVIFVVDFD